jgi:hypothetical protein
MKKVFPIQSGIVYSNGKIVPWSLVFSVLDIVLDEKTAEKVRRKVYEAVKVHATDVMTDSTNLTEVLGVKEGPNLHKRLLDKIAKLNKKVEDEFGSFEAKPNSGPGQTRTSVDKPPTGG